MPKKYLKEFYWRDYVYITLGLALYAIGLVGFIKPQGIVVGGSTGIGLVIEYATAIPFQYTYLFINSILFVIALKVLGLRFMIKTIYGVLTLTLLITICEKIISEPFVENEPLLSGLIGGIICGVGVGLVLSVNGSTGGSDTLIAIIGKYKNISFGRGVLLFDFVVISSSFFIFHDYQKIVAGLIVLGVMSYAMDMVINGSRQSVQYLIISEKYEIIADAINKELHRGCTLLEGMGWYTKKSTKVILVLAKRSESIEMFRLIRSIDEKAFISQSTVRGVYGEGFDKIKG
ncbi:uncharacterized membrane-anchored protein YitT (DUF2179 family) [Dysgonomonas alginatilytica]|uniref:Uncharacterized membrane-anchored protein YitT (DUF2179 family) n=1 Tax=Dysgonomonas alginatilytica TaxID=1605892 RepID=A0A2V3PRN1_9BACT|nr:YitT family protein [Dysgonomonas alginatilytica]PXV67426.1 uncharacterized membrane-anchored protein YitT (DUF2179 family) [Dysgonomonas alginatilytica]